MKITMSSWAILTSAVENCFPDAVTCACAALAFSSIATRARERRAEANRRFMGEVLLASADGSPEGALRATPGDLTTTFSRRVAVIPSHARKGLYRFHL